MDEHAEHDAVPIFVREQQRSRTVVVGGWILEDVELHGAVLRLMLTASHLRV